MSVMSAEPPSPAERAATRLSRLGRRATPMRASPPMTPTRSRPRRVVEAPRPITTTRETRTQVARATGARSRARPAAPQWPPAAHARAGRARQTPVARPGTPAAPATASPADRDREGAIHGASARGSSVESTPVSSSGTRTQPRVVSAPRAPMRVAVSGTGARRPSATAPAATEIMVPSAQAAPSREASRIHTLRLRALRVSLHLRRTRVATTTGPPLLPGPRPAR